MVGRAVGAKATFRRDYEYFLFDNDFRSFFDAESDCAARYDGGHLATFDSEEEYNAVTIWLQRTYTQTGSSSGIWLGYSDFDSEGHFMSIEDTSSMIPPYIKWAVGEANNYGGNENCALFRPADRYLNDVRCFRRLHYVCRRPGVQTVALLHVYGSNLKLLQFAIISISAFHYHVNTASQRK